MLARLEQALEIEVSWFSSNVNWSTKDFKHTWSLCYGDTAIDFARKIELYPATCSFLRAFPEARELFVSRFKQEIHKRFLNKQRSSIESELIKLGREES